MAKHRDCDMIGFPLKAARGGGWRRYFRNFDLSKRRHNHPRPWVAPVMFVVMGVLSCMPAGLA